MGSQMSQPLLEARGRSDAQDEESLENLFYCYEGVIYASSSADSIACLYGRAFSWWSFGMAVDHPIRSWCVMCVCDRRLDNCILAIILTYSVFMLLEPLEDEATSTQARVSAAVEWVCMCIFTIELSIRLVACGIICHTGAFFHDAWNVIDLAVICPYWVLLFFPALPSMASLRLVRALRPLRTIRSLPELRRIVVAFLHAIPALSTVAGLTRLSPTAHRMSSPPLLSKRILSSLCSAPLPSCPL